MKQSAPILRALAFFKSALLSGEAFTPHAQAEFDAAISAVRELERELAVWREVGGSRRTATIQAAARAREEP